MSSADDGPANRGWPGWFSPTEPALNGIEEANELLMPVALHASADDSALLDVEGGEQGRADWSSWRISVLARKPDMDCETLQRSWEGYVDHGQLIMRGFVAIFESDARARGSAQRNQPHDDPTRRLLLRAASPHS
jgi:hypothetical protein